MSESFLGRYATFRIELKEGGEELVASLGVAGLGFGLVPLGESGVVTAGVSGEREKGEEGGMGREGEKCVAVWNDDRVECEKVSERERRVKGNARRRIDQLNDDWKGKLAKGMDSRQRHRMSSELRGQIRTVRSFVDEVCLDSSQVSASGPLRKRD
jgi:hypothetical protein